MIKMLGEHLIRDNTVGLLELVKNSYDADATSTLIRLEKLKNQEKTTVVIRDNGSGMTPDDIENSWFMLAGSSKEKFKSANRKTALGRTPLGEKGVGRFAAQKIARRLELVTRPKDSANEYILAIDWDEFEEQEATLEEIPIEIKVQTPTEFKGHDHGTMLKMTDAREQWRTKNLQSLQTALIRFFSPGIKKINFDLKLECPEYTEYEKITKVDFLKKFQFSIDCEINGKGVGTFIFRARDPQGKIEEKKDQVNLWSRQHPDDWIQTEPHCGPFRIRIFGWMRSPQNLEAYNLSKSQLDELAGVSIFRDGFRILPYGDKGDDWLGLDLRRVNNPSEFFSNNQLMGVVDIDQTNNPNLKDKTNREGLWENPAFSDIRDLTLASLSLLEQNSYPHRNKSTTKKNDSNSKENLQEKINSLTQRVEKIQENQAETVEKTRESTVAEITKDYELVPKEEFKKLKEDTNWIEKSYQEFIGSKDIEKDALYHLCSVGLVAERYIHEFDRLIGICEKELLVLDTIGLAKDSATKLRYTLGALKNELELISSLKHVTNEEPVRKVRAEELVHEIKKIYLKDFELAGIKITQGGTDFDLNVKRSACGQVIDNVIVNAIYWLKQKTNISDRKLFIRYDKTQRIIEFANNGPGISPEIKKFLFKKPFVSAKPSGRGLGLFISQKIMEMNGGEIFFTETGDEISFKIKFPEKKTSPNGQLGE